VDEDLTVKTIEEVVDIIRSHKYENETSTIDAFTKFLSLKIGTQSPLFLLTLLATVHML
jgi:hypothetical protein